MNVRGNRFSGKHGAFKRNSAADNRIKRQVQHQQARYAEKHSRRTKQKPVRIFDEVQVMGVLAHAAAHRREIAQASDVLSLGHGTPGEMEALRVQLAALNLAESASTLGLFTLIGATTLIVVAAKRMPSQKK